MSQTKNSISRRTLFAGAGTLGAIAAVSRLAPTSPAPAAVAEALPPAPANGGGYTLSEHVKRYYKTALV